MNIHPLVPHERSTRPWRVRRLHHVAFAHRKPDVLDALESLFGLHCGESETGPGLIERMFEVGDAAIQTIEAFGPGGVDRFVDKRGPALHHVALAVDDIDAAVADLLGRGVRMVDEVARRGGGGTRIAFVHPSACGGLLVELVQPPREEPSC